MPNLSCGVDNCAYNQNDMCSLNSIKVNGSFANHSEATEPATSVACEAEKCCYNKNCKCHAESIDISGDYAQHQDNTECSTFRQE